MTTEEIKIHVATLSKWLSENKKVTIIDVRSKADREEWSIPGSVHVDVYERLKAGDKTVFNDFKTDPAVPVVTVCSAGKTSLIAAEILKDKGFEVFSLDGGMKSWNFAWNTAQTSFDDTKVIQIRRSAKGCLSYIIASQGEAIVIDASLHPEVYKKLADENNWTIRFVTDTHIHADYLSRTRELAQLTGATHLLIEYANVQYPFTPVKHGDSIRLGKAMIEVMHTPGHTMESTTFKLGDAALFTGDTLFVDGVGRPDLKADANEALRRSKLLFLSLQQLLKLNPAIQVFPAHYAQAVPFDNLIITETLSTLKRKLKMLAFPEMVFFEYTTSRIPPTPPNYLTIASLNKIGSHEGYTPADLEAGANRCAIG